MRGREVERGFLVPFASCLPMPLSARRSRVALLEVPPGKPNLASTHQQALHYSASAKRLRISPGIGMSPPEKRSKCTTNQAWHERG